MAVLVDSRTTGRRVLYRPRDSHIRTLIAEALYQADHQLSGIAEHD